MTSKFSPSRRALFKAAGLSAAALAAPQIMTRATFAQGSGPSAGAEAPRFNRIAVGDFEVTTLFDGARVMDDPHSIFGINPDFPFDLDRG
jgi:hypothetical protein